MDEVLQNGWSIYDTLYPTSIEMNRYATFDMNYKTNSHGVQNKTNNTTHEIYV